VVEAVFFRVKKIASFYLQVRVAGTPGAPTTRHAECLGLPDAGESAAFDAGFDASRFARFADARTEDIVLSQLPEFSRRSPPRPVLGCHPC
jgi:hypothetical protein